MGTKSVSRKSVVFLTACLAFFIENVYAENTIQEEDTPGVVSVDPIIRDEMYPITPILIEPQLATIRFGPYDYMIWTDHGGWWSDARAM